VKAIDPIDAKILQRARDWLLRLSSEDVTASDLADLRGWLASDSVHRRAFERERSFWQDLEPHRALFEPALPARAMPRAGRQLWPRRPSRRVWASASAIAASLALILAAPSLILHARADHIAAIGQAQTVTLPDKSTAMLDSGAAIAVRYSGSQRRIELLQGRAWFQVRHGDTRPFRVAARGGIAEDIGTAYEVSRNDDAVETAVSEGTIRLKAKGADGLILHAGERARYDGRHAARLPAIAPDRVATWRLGELLIDDVPLDEAVRQVARYRPGGTYSWPGSAKAKRVSGVFRTDRPDDALAALASNAGLKLLHLPGGIIILH